MLKKIEEYYSDTGTLSRCYYIDERGRYQGEYKSFHEIGENQLWGHYHYVDGLRHGECREYNTHGQLCFQCLYVNDKRHGEYVWRSSSGQVLSRTLWVDDVCVVEDVGSLTEQEKFKLSLKYGVKWLTSP